MKNDDDFLKLLCHINWQIKSGTIISLFGKYPNVAIFDGCGWCLVFMEYQGQFLLNYNENKTVGFTLKMWIKWYKECKE